MKRILPILLCLLLFACQPNPIDRNLSEFLSTRSAEPLESTIWEHKTQDEYNRYISFREGVASLFYGTYEDGELQRWSEFYSGPYYCHDGKLLIALTYPLWGDTKIARNEEIVAHADGYTIVIDGDEYFYWGPYTEQIEGQWMFIFAGITPWE